jgi:hypothetical protein
MFTRPHPCDFLPSVTYKDSDIIVIDNFYKPYEAIDCIEKINKMEFSTYYNMKHRGYCNDKYLAKLIFTIINNFLNIDDWSSNEVNNEFRFIKGDNGYHMTEHFDESKIISINDKSFYSVLLYLNDDNEGDIVFNEKKISFKPKAGRLVIFHQKLLHHSLPSTNEKYFIHSEIMFERNNKINNESDRKAFEIFKLAQDLTNDEKIKQEDVAFKMSSELEKLIFNI